MKKTLLITLDYPPIRGGVASYWSNLAAKMPAESICVLVSEDENSVHFDKDQEYTIYRRNLLSCNKWCWPKWLPMITYARNIIKKEKIEKLIVTHILPVGTVALILKLLFRIPYMVSMHGLDIAYASCSLKKKILARLILRYSDNIIVNSDYTKNLMFEKLCSKCGSKTEIIYPCPNVTHREIETHDLNLFKQAHQLVGKKILLTVARLVRRKGQDMVIKSLKKIKEKVPNISYLIVGKGQDTERLKELARENGVEDQILFFHDIRNKELSFFYQLADVFIMPSRKLDDGDVEGFGIVYLEANSYGKPAIAGNVGGSPEAVLHNQTGLIVDPEDETDIASAVTTLLLDEEKAIQLGQAGKKRVEQEFSWDKQADKLKEMIK
jgi:phosphatidyl-myo-inositol dimannoside synthase